MARVSGQNLGAGLLRRSFPIASLVAVILVIIAIVKIAAIPPAADHIIDRSVLEDPTGSLTIDEIVGGTFSEMKPVFLAGYTRSVHWFRIVVRPTGPDQQLAFRIRPAFLDRVELYAQEPGSTTFHLADVTGDTIPYGARTLASVSLALPIEPAAEEASYYLRLESTSTTMFNIQALDVHALRQAEMRDDVALGIFAVIGGWIFVWAARDCMLRPHWLTFTFCISHLCYMAYTLAIMGYLSPLLPGRQAHLADYITSLLCCISPITTISLHRAALVLYAPARLVSGIALLMSAAVMCVILIFVFTPEQQTALKLNTTIIFFSSFFFFVIALAPISRARPMPALLKAAFSMQAVFIIASTSPLLGFASVGEWTLQYPYIVGLIYALLMFLFLHDRSQAQIQRSRENSLRLELVSQALDSERRQRETQARFLAMLTHEIKTPLSVIRLSLDRNQLEPARFRDIDEALREMDATVERCNLAEQFESGQISMTGEYVGIGDALADAIARHAPSISIDMRAQTAGGIECDRHMLDVILSNLLENAVKYARSETPITIFSQPVLSNGVMGVEVIVENRIGRSGAPDPEMVFEKFYRTPGARTKSGSGLGLYIVEGVTELLGGTITCAVSGDMIRFRLWLPRTRPTSADDAHRREDFKNRAIDGNATVPNGVPI